jgi:hypothetical protein
MSILQRNIQTSVGATYLQPCPVKEISTRHFKKIVSQKEFTITLLTTFSKDE